MRIIPSGTVADDYDLIDEWQLSLRSVEAIESNKKEMSMYIRSCERLLYGLRRQIEQRKIDRLEINTPESLLSGTLDHLQRSEIIRLEKTLEDATDLFDKVVDGFIYEPEGFLDQVEAGEAEELLLDAREENDSSSRFCF